MSSPSLTDTPFVLALHQVPELIRIEVESSDDYFTLSVIPAQLAFESFSAQAADDPLLPLQKVVRWIEEKHNRLITETQAWDIVVAVRTAFDLHKKKLSDMLILPSGSPASTLIP